MVYDGKTVPLLSITNTKLRDFPIYHNLTMLQTDVTSTNANSPYPVSFERTLKFDIISFMIVDILCERHINKQFCYYHSVEYHYGDCESQQNL